MNKIDEITKWLNDNTKKIFVMEKEETISKIMDRFDVPYNTARSYYYKWKKENKIAPTAPKEFKKILKEEVDNRKKDEKDNNSKIVIKEDFDKKRIEKLTKNMEVKGNFYTYKISLYGEIKVFAGDLFLKEFKTIEEVREFEREENRRFAEEMQEIKDIFNIIA